MRLAVKTVSYGTVHICVATGIAYLLTGNFAAALGIGLLEPVVQSGVYAVHEHIWQRSDFMRGPVTQQSHRVAA